MRPINEPEDSFKINILPMIDVIFSILAFFIIAPIRHLIYFGQLSSVGVAFGTLRMAGKFIQCILNRKII